jgi:hypothetical protein
MADDVIVGLQSKQRGGDSRVRDIDLGSIDHPFSQIRAIRRHGFEHEGARQQIDMASNRVVAHAEGTREP